jgi:hypothetical protein
MILAVAMTMAVLSVSEHLSSIHCFDCSAIYLVRLQMQGAVAIYASYFVAAVRVWNADGARSPV